MFIRVSAERLRLPGNMNLSGVTLNPFKLYLQELGHPILLCRINRCYDTVRLPRDGTRFVGYIPSYHYSTHKQGEN